MNKIKKLYTKTDGWAEWLPDSRELMDKINEIIDRINGDDNE